MVETLQHKLQQFEPGMVWLDVSNHIMAMMGLDVVVNDPMVDWERYPDASRLITDDLDYAQLTPAASDYVVIATQHKGDHESIRRATGFRRRLHRGDCQPQTCGSGDRLLD
jgi:hypothetical protein